MKDRQGDKKGRKADGRLCDRFMIKSRENKK